MNRLALVWLVALVPALAGCTFPAPTADPTCPAWVLGPGSNENTHVWSDTFNRTDRTDELPAPLDFQEHPLDRIELSFQADTRDRGIEVYNGTMAATFTTADGRTLRAYERPGESGKTRYTWQEGIHRNFTLFIDLAAPSMDPDPQAVEVHWHFSFDPADESRSVAGVRYTASYWYRSC